MRQAVTGKLLLMVSLSICAAGMQSHASTDIAWGVAMQHDYRLTPDITYLRASGVDLKLDVIARPNDDNPAPVLLYIHGGGWVAGSKDRMFLHFLPYLQLGMAVVNVGYRLGPTALAPAAVEDARCALRWVLNNAREYNLDTSRIVVSGHSAGGHLSLTTGMLPASAGLDRRCPARKEGAGRADTAPVEMSVAAIVNWFGITDVGDLVEGTNAKTYAVAWKGHQSNWAAIAERVSPLTWVRRGLPPVLTIHGDADSIVPYSHAERLHAALDAAEVDNQLYTISGGGHGGFSQDENTAAMNTIQTFLVAHGVLNN